MGVKSTNASASYFDRFGRTTAGVVKIIASGGTISNPGDGYTYHTYTTPGSFIIVSGNGLVDMVAVGAGGGGGGADGPINGGGGAGGGAVISTFSLLPITLSVSVGGGGGNGANNVPSGGGGAGGSNGGGPGGGAGPVSGGGGGGGGWSGVSNGPAYYIVAGGGAGGGGANEGPANDTQAKGGGSPANTYSSSTLTGATGTSYPEIGPDGGGFGGGGGGYNGSGGGGGGNGSPNQGQNGGSNFVNPIASNSSTYVGESGGFQPTSPNNYGGQGAPGFLPANPSWTTLIPGTAGDGGAGNGGSGVSGIVVIRYLT